jgi:hypothetical protein
MAMKKVVSATKSASRSAPVKGSTHKKAAPKKALKVKTSAVSKPATAKVKAKRRTPKAVGGKAAEQAPRLKPAEFSALSVLARSPNLPRTSRALGGRLKSPLAREIAAVLRGELPPASASREARETAEALQRRPVDASPERETETESVWGDLDYVPVGRRSQWQQTKGGARKMFEALKRSSSRKPGNSGSSSPPSAI